jgi:hypothetical protein
MRDSVVQVDPSAACNEQKPPTHKRQGSMASHGDSFPSPLP